MSCHSRCLRFAPLFTAGAILALTIPQPAFAQQPELVDPPTLQVPQTTTPFKMRAYRPTQPLTIPGFDTQVQNLAYYQVTRPGATLPETYPNQLLSPTFSLQPGQALRIDFTSNLPQATNLHSHGFHASAKAQDRGTRYGDCVLPMLNAPTVANAALLASKMASHSMPLTLVSATSPNGAALADPCSEMVPASMPVLPADATIPYTYALPGPQSGRPHPTGSFFYHPHVHGVAELQMASGLTGMFQVEKKRFEFYTDPATGQNPDRAKSRFIVLKDHKIARNDAVTPYRFVEFDEATQGSLQGLGLRSQRTDAYERRPVVLRADFHS